MRTLYAVFRSSWRAGADFLAVAGGPTWTYADLDRVTADLGRRLRGAGLAPGARLVSVVDRSPWNVFLYLACARVGIVYVPLNPVLSRHELAPVLVDADPALVVAAPSLAQALGTLLPPTVPTVTLDVDGRGSLTELEATDEEVDAHLSLPADHPAAIVFTSGTTGRPKGVLIPHALFAGKARALAEALDYTADDRLLHALPLHHAHGLFMTLHCVLHAGASLLFLPRFDAAETVRLLPEATVFSGVPTMYRRMAAESGLRAAAARTRLFVSGSAPLPAELFAAFERASGHRIAECWGMTETMTNTANRPGDCRPGSAGHALPGVELRVVDGVGRPLPADVSGTLEVGFGAPFATYWRRPPIDQPVLRDGRLVTGDVGSIDDEGRLTIVGRTSDVIISGGYNVHPREVELALEAEPEVARAAVFAVPHADYGEAVVAAIEPATATVDLSELLGRLRGRLVGYKVPKALFVEVSLPVTELGKLQRRVLSAKYSEHFSERI